MKDFIIVGRGLSACVMMHTFRQHGLTFINIGDPSLSNSSRIAAGLWNPIVFKRMTAGWMASELIACLKEFYRECEKSMGVALVTPREMIRPFSEEQEEILWLKKSEAELKQFIEPAIYRDKTRLPHFRILRGYGVVKGAGNLDVSRFLEETASYFGDSVTESRFDHSRLEISDDHVKYGKHTAKNILFCEGHLVSRNPWFSWIPLKPAKGEILELHSEKLELGTRIFNRNGFIFRTAPSLFKTGSTYQWDELSDEPTQMKREELVEKLETMISCEYQIVSHQAGVRPSSIDLRPIIGPHPLESRLWVFNGLGSKGVMLAPYFCKNFVHFYLKKTPLHPEATIERHYQLYGNTQKI